MKKQIKKVDKFIEDHYKELGGVTLGLSIAMICKGISMMIHGK